MKQMQRTILAGTLSALAFITTVGVPAAHGEFSASGQMKDQAEHSRVLPLEGGQNFRDLGGYRTRDGRSVRWGMLYRSGAMNTLTDADYRYLAKLGIRTVCDFRSTAERNTAPVRWSNDVAPKVFADDYKMDMGELGLRAAKNWTAEEARATMAASYPRILGQFNSQYRRMFQELLAGNAPLAFNCTGGKDRTGIAAALILTALDVPRETVIEDYVLSDRYVDLRKAAAAAGSLTAGWQEMPAPAREAFARSDRSYIESVFRVLDAHPGGAEGYLRDELGLSRDDLLALRQRYIAS